MIRRIIITAIILLASFVSFTQSASAGGWATIALSTPLETVITGEETTSEFRVLAHGNKATPMTGMETSFLFLHEDTGFFVAVNGVPTADPEVYTVSFLLDQEGAWNARAMIHNYADYPLLTTFPELTATAPAEVAAA
jgi:hypothetical protein